MSDPTTPDPQSDGAGPDGRTVLITGAAGGLGRAFALGFARRGYRVAVADVNLEGAEETAKLVADAGAEAAAFHADVTSVDS
ncbi:SDR family NAD(P)-dependent oxidoreductase, partial [Arthrobacter sp. 2YAF22_2]|uniref:SDR family NAD(P)-dependent oxidoreductase n=1 Tax=Arthrobacter sp. 2YAF22_2 TaxID=3233029 RepID=UPI003F9206F2